MTLSSIFLCTLISVQRGELISTAFVPMNCSFERDEPHCVKCGRQSSRGRTWELFRTHKSTDCNMDISMTFRGRRYTSLGYLLLCSKMEQSKGEHLSIFPPTPLTCQSCQLSVTKSNGSYLWWGQALSFSTWPLEGNLPQIRMGMEGACLAEVQLANHQGQCYIIQFCFSSYDHLKYQ